MPASVTVAAVERAADVLLHFCVTPGPDLGVTEIAEDLGLSKAAVHRVLASLRTRGLVALDPRTHRYSLGTSALRLGMSYLDRIDVRRIARPFLQELSERTQETATLSIKVGPDSRVYVDQVTPQREVIMSVTVGKPYPLHTGASSRALLAFLPEDALEAYIESVPVSAAALREDLAEVRAAGWACSTAQRMSGAASVAAPVLDHIGHPVAVISVCGPAERFAAELETCREALLQTTQGVSRQLGFAR